MRAGDREAPLRIPVTADLRRVPAVSASIRAFLASRGMEARRIHTAEVVVEEVLTNIIRHGGPTTGSRTIDVEVIVIADGVRLSFTDDGIAFDPRKAPAFDATTPLEHRTGGGMGVHLVRSLAREVRYERTDGRNRLEVAL